MKQTVAVTFNYDNGFLSVVNQDVGLFFWEWFYYAKTVHQNITLW
jgi:hypothetical protein